MGGTRGATVDGEGAPRARRLPRARWGDTRLWLGVLLVAGSTLAGARILATADDGVAVMRATRDLSAGSAPTDLEPVTVSRAIAAHYLSGPSSGVLRWPVAAGELVPAGALMTGPTEPVREVTVAVDPLGLPPALGPGDVLDVWGTVDGEVPRLVLEAVAVEAVGIQTGLGGEVAVVLRVPARAVAAVVAAARTGVIDLVSVPIDSADSVQAGP